MSDLLPSFGGLLRKRVLGARNKKSVMKNNKKAFLKYRMIIE
ncbi:hypothetical protein HPHPP13_1136 [Helicobacter pylori Hp P-13]|nr:hypothetical protein HPHPP13_1136 [Helicobacter pylori Hp P-13]